MHVHIHLNHVRVYATFRTQLTSSVEPEYSSVLAFTEAGGTPQLKRHPSLSVITIVRSPSPGERGATLSPAPRESSAGIEGAAIHRL